MWEVGDLLVDVYCGTLLSLEDRREQHFTSLLAFNPEAAMLPNGLADMRSAVMITSRDFPLVCLNDGRLQVQINNQPTVATQVTILISNFFFDLDERFQPAA